MKKGSLVGSAVAGIIVGVATYYYGKRMYDKGYDTALLDASLWSFSSNGFVEPEPTMKSKKAILEYEGFNLYGLTNKQIDEVYDVCSPLFLKYGFKLMKSKEELLDKLNYVSKGALTNLQFYILWAFYCYRSLDGNASISVVDIERCLSHNV